MHANKMVGDRENSLKAFQTTSLILSKPGAPFPLPIRLIVKRAISTVTTTGGSQVGGGQRGSSDGATSRFSTLQKYVCTSTLPKNFHRVAGHSESRPHFAAAVAVVCGTSGRWRRDSDIRRNFIFSQICHQPKTQKPDKGPRAPIRLRARP